MDDRQGYEYAHGSRMPDTGDGLEARATMELVRELFAEGQVLLKQELRRAKEEARVEAKKVARAGAALGLSGVVMHVALILTAGFLVAVGATFLPLWLSTLIVLVLFGAIGAGLALYGKKRIDQLELDRPMRGIKEERAWLTDTMRNVRSHRHGHA